MQMSKISNNIIQRLLEANIARTHYMLSNFRNYVKQQINGLDLKISRNILSILSDSLGDKPEFSEEDKNLIDKCGNIICMGLQHILFEIRDFPWSIGQNAYIILYENYFREDYGDKYKLKERLQLSGLFLNEKEIEAQLSDAERMMAALVFESKLLYASAFANGKSLEQNEEGGYKKE